LLRFLVFLALISAFLFVVTLARAEIDGDRWRGQSLYEAWGCVACHGRDGLAEDPDAPHLAGQQRNYMFNQLVNFRKRRPSGRLGEKVSERHHQGMAAQTERMRDSDISDIVAFLNRLPCSPGSGVEPISRPGAAAKCDLCHGINGRSPFVAIPVITGQKETYIAQQLYDFRAAAADFWGDNVRSHRFVLAAKMDLTDAEIAATAGYYSQLSCR